ncbi:SDR family NAD(P)-dependent oxidoreductase [Euzebya sp.]|uniref:SDR family NAD(P)-dependent oxidoreductase n=1 Tax=Euzebya sp. TaxID=1971409 RepID=UPI003519130D
MTPHDEQTWASRFRLDGRRVLVAGAGQGMGAATSTAIHALGGTVACADVDPDRARAIADRTSGIGLVGDLTRAADCERVVDQAADQLGGLDGLVDIIGMWPDELWRTLDRIEPEVWRRGAELTLDHAFYLSRAVLPHLRDGGGSVVFISSLSGATSAPLHGPYGAGKAGLRSLARTLALENAPHGVRANTVSPGAIRTPRIAASSPAETLDRIGASIPAGHLGDVDDIAGAVAFLLSDAAAYVTGVDLRVDGGAGVVYPLHTVGDG